MTPTMELPGEFAQLIAQAQTGDGDAARRLYEDYGPHIVRAVRRRLHARLRSRFDSIDFAQDVWASFFGNVLAKGQFTSPKELVALLTTMARNKVLETVRPHTQGRKRNVQREDSLERHHDRGANLPAVQQTPSQIVMGKEAWDRLLASQPPVYRHILLLLRDGRPREMIAQELGVSVRTVQRVMDKLNS